MQVWFFFEEPFQFPLELRWIFFICAIKSGRFGSDVLFTCADPSFQSHSDQSSEMHFGIRSKFRIWLIGWARADWHTLRLQRGRQWKCY